MLHIGIVLKSAHTISVMHFFIGEVVRLGTGVKLWMLPSVSLVDGGLSNSAHLKKSNGICPIFCFSTCVLVAVLLASMGTLVVSSEINSAQATQQFCYNKFHMQSLKINHNALNQQFQHSVHGHHGTP